MREVANDNACERIASFVTALSAARPDLSREVAAFGIECALEAAEFESRAQSVDLVWTGPETSDVSVRRGAAALLELIESAQTDLIIMSFASFRIPDADAALSRAADRGVRVYLILESEEDSSGRYRQYGALAFSALAHNPRVRTIAGQRRNARTAPCCTRRLSSPTVAAPSSPVQILRSMRSMSTSRSVSL